VYAWERQTVFWRFSAPILAAYAVFVPLWLGGSTELLPWAIAALVAGLSSRLLSTGLSPGEASDAATPPVVDPSPLGLVEGPGRGADEATDTAPETPAPSGETGEAPPSSVVGLGLMEGLTPPPRAREKARTEERPAPAKKPELPPGLLDW
jgi:hypothetical protein